MQRPSGFVSLALLVAVVGQDAHNASNPHPNGTEGGSENYTGGNYTNHTTGSSANYSDGSYPYPNSTDGSYMNYTGGHYTNDTGGMHSNYTGSGGTQWAPPNVSEVCPEPVKSMLRHGSLWGLEIRHRCSDEDGVEFHGEGPMGWTHGRWEDICRDPSNYSLTIHTSPKGLGEGCQSDADCAHIPCLAKCMPCADSHCRAPYQCMPQSSECHNVTRTWISPEEFVAACPPDSRDHTCMGIKAGWDAAGCRIFEEPSEFMPSNASSIASQCLSFVMQYKECVYMHFAAADYQYYMHRQVPDHIVSMLTRYINGTGGGQQCIKIPRGLADAVNAIPCGPPPVGMR